MSAPRTAEQIAASLQHTSQRYHEGSIDYDTLGIRNRRDWDDAEASARVKDAVLAILRSWRPE